MTRATPQLPTDRSATAFELMRQIERGDLVEPAPQLQSERADWNLQTICIQDTGQSNRRRLAVRALKATGRVAGLGCLYAAKGAWVVTRYIFTPRPSRRSIHITIIER